jgi:hypothetical protein
VNKEKAKISKKEFAEVLYYWLSHHLAKQAIKETAKDLDFKIKSDEDFNKILQELFALNMWLIVRACERVFEDEDKRNECLDIFHHLVYERHTEETEKIFGKWMTLMGAKYSEYNKAMETEHPSTPLWVLAKIVNKNLFGEVKEDPCLQFHIGAYVGISAKHLEELIKKCDIE